MSARVAVIGGGVAGLACACELANAGLDVTLVEAANRLGGRACSFRDKRSGIDLDNCQHVLLGCCEAAVEFLTKIRSIDLVDFPKDVGVIGPDGRALTIAESALPAPLHLMPSIMQSSYLARWEKLDLIRMMAGVAISKPGKDQSAGEYLRTVGCPETLIERLVEPVLISALNEDATSASAGYARMVLSKTLMGSKKAYRLGVPRGPLSELIEKAASEYLSARGACIRLSTRVERLEIEGGRVRSVVLAGGEELECERYVCAVTPWALAEMGYEARGAERLVWKPIVAAHLFYENPVSSFDRACMVGEPFGWAFNKSKDFSLSFSHIQAVASAAERIIDLSNDELVRLADRAVRRAAPERGRMVLQRAVVYRARRATFATAGCDAFRPPSATRLENFFLAGDWTDTRWPATIEGAVRSGVAAARAVIAR